MFHPTVNIEFVADADTEKHLKQLEHELKQIDDTQIALIEPKDHTAPALFSIGFRKGGDRAVAAIHHVAQLLSTFLRADPSAQSQKQIFLVTAEGDRVDIEPLSQADIERVMLQALE